MKKKTVSKVLCCLLATMLLLTACSSGTTPEKPEGDEPAKRDDLVVGYVAESQELDPHKSSDTLTWQTLMQVFDTLVRIEADGSVSPWLAESWDVSEDGKEVLFKIRQGVKFHNGDTLTTEDVAYSLNRSFNSPQTVKFTAVFDSAEVVDDTTVKVKLPNAYAPFLFCLGNPCTSIVSKAAVEQYGDDFGRNPVGTGAYKYVDWVSGEYMKMTRFDDWWNGQAPIKDLTIRFITNTSTAAIALEKGEIDFLHNPASPDLPALEANPKLKVISGPGGGYYHISFNNGKESVFHNQKLREAVSYAIDREAMLIGGLDGNGGICEFPAAPAAFGYNPDFKQNEYNPEKAKQLLKEAGYELGQLTVRIRTNENPQYAKPCEVLQEAMRQIGINSTLELLERATYLDEVTRNFDYDVTIYLITASVPDCDYTMYTRLHSSMFGAGNNFTQTNIPELDDVLDRARVSQDPEERKQLYTEAAQIIKDSSTLIPILYNIYNNAANKDLKGFKYHTLNYHFFYELSW